ncbi:MAG: hypothetical protein FWD69_03845 [Polyangiaceae bacterium]|nr:hypothetical protein [Polyangiaceae bacterium]
MMHTQFVHVAVAVKDHVNDCPRGGVYLTKSVFDSLLREIDASVGRCAPCSKALSLFRPVLALRPSLDSLATAVELALKRRLLGFWFECA